jgi:hypothetical protein
MAFALAAAAACGKKGPPLAPLAKLPNAPADASARRAGDRATIRFTIPVANITGIRPADLARVDVYAWTEGPPRPASGQAVGSASQTESAGVITQPAQVFKYGTVVATVPVRKPPPPPPERKPGEPPPPPPPPPTGPGLDQGAQAEVTEVLTSDSLAPLVLPQKKKKPPRGQAAPANTLAPPDVTMAPATAHMRYYLVVGVNHGGDRGPAATRVGVPTWPPPAPPTNPNATVREHGIEVTWTPPPLSRQPIGPAVALPAPSATPVQKPAPTPAVSPTQPGTPPTQEEEEEEAAPAKPPAAATPPVSETPPAPSAGAQPVQPGQQGPPSQALPPLPEVAEITGAVATGLLPSRLLTPWPASRSGFNVYEVAAPNAIPKNVPPPPAVPPFPKLLTPSPVDATTFTDSRVEFGEPRCFVVRTVDIVGTASIESEASPVVCVTPKDVFPPAAPRSLGAVAGEGVISLIWEANTEPDLAGYIVLRGVAPGDRLEPITPQPIKETTYRDTSVRRGVRYVYVVIAVDTAKPPNRSQPSNRVEEAAR